MNTKKIKKKKNIIKQITNKLKMEKNKLKNLNLENVEIVVEKDRNCDRYCVIHKDGKVKLDYNDFICAKIQGKGFGVDKVFLIKHF